MVEKLKSILNRIRWSLLLKAAVFALAWYVPIIPFWLFVIIALYLYFSPLAQSRGLAWSFFVLLLLMFLEPVGPLFAVIFGAIFFYILLIKEFVLIDRASAHEVTVLALSFLLIRDFYMREGGSINGWSLFYSLCTALIVGMLISQFIRSGEGSGITESSASSATGAPAGGIRRIATWLCMLVAWQFIIVGLFLPVDFVYQTVIVFLGIIPMIDLVPQYLSNGLSREKVLMTASVLFVLFVFTLGSARWGL